MTSEIRANTLKNRVGLGTVSFTDSGPVVSGIVTSNTLRLPNATSGSLGRLQLGNGLHFSMYHDGTNSHIINNNGYLTIQSQAGVNGIFIARNAEVNLYFGSSVRLQTSSSGVTINRDIDVDGHTNLDNVSIAGVTTFSVGPIVPNGQSYRGIINSGSQTKIIGGYISGSDTLRLGESMYLTTTGLGIGQPTPATTLEIKSDAHAQTTATIPTLRITNDDGSAVANDITGSVEFHTEDSSDPNHISGFMRNISETAAGVNYSLIFGTKDSNIAGDATEKLRIFSSGNLGVGDYSSTSLTHAIQALRTSGTTVVSAKNTNGNATFYAEASNGNTAKLELFQAGTSGYSLRTGSTDALQFFRDSTFLAQIDSSGRLLLGHSSSQEVYGTAKLQIQGTTGATSSLSLLRHGNSPYLTLGSSGGSALGAVTALANDARIGQITFAGADGTDVNTHSASIAAYVDGSVSSNTVPGRIVFATSTGASEVERLRIASTGELGLGLTQNPPTGSFTMRLTETPEFNIYSTQHAQNNNIKINFGVGQSASVSGNTGARIEMNIPNAGGQMTGDLIFHTNSGDNLQERLRITSGGQLLISGNTGWNESSALLSIATDDAAGANMLSNSSAVYNHNNPAFIHIQNRYNTGTGQEAGIILHSKSSYNGSWAIYSKRSTSNYLADLIFRCRTGGSSSAQRFRMNSSGMMGFNGNPNRYLHVYGRTDGGNFGTAAFEQNNTGNSSAVMFMSTLRDGNAGESFLQCNRDQDNNGQGVRAVFYIRTNGDVDSDTNSYGGISDIKLKENIVDANSQWDDIKNIRVRNFNFKDNPNQKMLGVVAQEVETVSAGLVKDCPDENITSPGPEGTSTKSVKYSILYMKAIKALQEAQTRIETLEAKVSALEGS